MAKTIIREIIITLLLCIAIIVILGILLYGYVPANKVMPEKVSYTTPANIKEELSKNDSVDESEVILTYEVDSTDLSNYQKIKDYKPGKTNPFSSYQNEEENTEDKNTTGTTNKNTTSENSTSQKNETNTNTNNTSYFQDKGLK